MTSNRPAFSVSPILASVGLAVFLSACAGMYDNQVTSQPVPDLEDPGQRSASLLRYCTRLHGSGDLQLAAAICNRAHEIDPTDPEPLLELASIMQDLRLSDSAAEAYRAVLLLDPQRVDALYGLGKVQIEARRYDMATQSLETALLVDPNDARIYNALGIVMDQRGDHTTAQAYYRKGLTQSPRNIPIRNNFGLSLVLAGDQEAGLSMLREVAAETGADPAASLNLAMASQAKVAAPNPDPQQDTTAQPQALQPDFDAAETPETAEIAAPEEAGLPELTPSAGPAPSTDSPDTDAASPPPVSVLRSYEPGSNDLDIAAIAPQIEQFEPAPLEQPSPATKQSAEAAPDPVVMPQDDVVIASSARDGRAPASAFPTDTTQLAAAPAPAAEESSAPKPAYSATALVSDRNDFEQVAPIQQTAARPASGIENPAQEPRRTLPLSLTAASEASVDSQDHVEDGDSFYTVQLGSYREPEGARNGWDIVADAAGDLLAGLDGVIVRADLGIEQGIVYRVRTEPMADHDTAQQLCSQLQAQGVDCLAIKASHSITDAATVDRICTAESGEARCTARKPSSLKSTGLPFNPSPAG
jgi:Flp pilus assembly protein TadD